MQAAAVSARGGCKLELLASREERREGPLPSCPLGKEQRVPRTVSVQNGGPPSGFNHAVRRTVASRGRDHPCAAMPSSFWGVGWRG